MYFLEYIENDKVQQTIESKLVLGKSNEDSMYDIEIYYLSEEN